MAANSGIMQPAALWARLGGMGEGGRGINAARAGLLAAVAIAWAALPAVAGDDVRRSKTAVIPGAVAVETVYFADPGQKPVAVVRGVQRQVPPVRPATI